MSRAGATARLSLRLLAGILGVFLLIHLVLLAGPSKLLENISRLGWRVILVIALGGVSHLLKTWAWRLTLLDQKHRVSFWRMFGLRLASEAVGQFGILGQAFGETFRVSALSSSMPLATGIASVTIDRAFFIISATVVTTVGMTIALIAWPLPRTISLVAALVAFAFLCIILITAVAVRRRWAVLSGTAQKLGRLAPLRGWIDRKRLLIDSVENRLFDFYHRTPGEFWGSFALNLVCHGAAVFEVYLILCLMGVKVSLLAAFAIEVFTKLVNVLGLVIPGGIGTYEGGNMLIGKVFAVSGAVGLTLGLTRRLRAIFWTTIGAFCLVKLSKSRNREGSIDDTHALPQGSNSPTPENRQEVVKAGGSHVAVILANDAGAGSVLARVGTLPVALRAILGATKAGATRIAIVLNRVTGPRVKRDLLNTGRLPRSVEWCWIGDGETSLASLLGQFISEGAERVVLAAGDTTYHPSLQRRAGEWNGKSDALALTSGDQIVGLFALSQDATIDLAKHCPPNINSLDELRVWLTSTHTVEYEAVPEEKWQRIVTPQDRQSAEDKLDRWLVKPTDGVFAKFNRRVSVPISRQIIRFPITPNMVSLFTLGVSFISGVFFACGGYRNMLLGAMLSLFASILDGCDGEVARLKLQESDFGCWLETICDYLYYLFIFSGMTIGLLRTSGTRTYLVWGGVLIFGAVLSFVISGVQRHHLTAGRPEQLLATWQKQAARRPSDPLLYLGRHTEFLIRRCFLPYAILFFALFNIANVAFILCALGANVAWLVALHSHRSFSAVRVSSAINSPAAAA